MRSRTLIKLFVKLETTLLIEPAENCLISTPVLLLIQKLFWASDKGFKIVSCVAPQTLYLHSIQIWRVIRWPLSLFKHSLTVLVEDCWDTCNARRAPMHVVESAAPSGSSRVHSSMNFGSSN